MIYCIANANLNNSTHNIASDKIFNFLQSQYQSMQYTH